MISQELEEALAAARSLLSEDFELGMMNDVPAGYSGGPLPSDVPADYVDFLNGADGGIFGRVVLFKPRSWSTRSSTRNPGKGLRYS
ncbi:hypothetical protein GCM10027074_58360 [Streptomyces deserti]